MTITTVSRANPRDDMYVGDKGANGVNISLSLPSVIMSARMNSQKNARLKGIFSMKLITSPLQVKTTPKELHKLNLLRLAFKNFCIVTCISSHKNYTISWDNNITSV